MIPLPSKPKIVKKEKNKAVFEIEGLYPGYGVTIGNILRRVLLSSLEGAAITQVKIKGASHEFSTLSGVLEDVVMILLNLKKLRFQSFTKEPQTATLVIKGEKIVKAKDFKLSPQLELGNPENHIATLTKPSSELNIEVEIEKGMGYESAERREREKSEIGVIPVDAIFTPVKKVSFSVENMRVGKRTDFDRLKVEVETEGTITPGEAFRQTLDILCKHFLLMLESFEKKEPETKMEKPSLAKTKVKKKEADVKKMKTEELKIAERTKNALLKNNVKDIGGLLRKSEKNLLNFEGLGEKAVGEVKKALKKLGLGLKK